MSLKKALWPFRIRLFLYSLLQALLTALIAALSAFIIYTVLNRLGLAPVNGLIPNLVIGSVFALTASVETFRRYPTLKRTAANIDLLALEERVSTMVEYRTQDSAILRMQRRDALGKLQAIKPRSLYMALPHGKLVTLCVLILLTFCVCLTPIHRPELAAANTLNMEQEMSEEERLIRNMIRDMRSRVTYSGMSEEDKEAFLQQLDTLEADLGNKEADLDDLAMVTQASVQMAQTVDALQIYSNWIEEFLKYDCLKELGEAIIAEDKLKVQQAFLNMEYHLLNLHGQPQQDALMEIYLALGHALEDGSPSGADAEMAYAFSLMQSDIMESAVLLLNKQDAAQRIHSALDMARGRVLIALGGGEELAEGEDSPGVKKSDLADSGASSNMDMESEGEEGSSQDLLQSGRTMYSDDPAGMRGAGTGTIGKQRHAVTEHIYEPALNTQALISDYIPGAQDTEGNVQRILADSVLKTESSVPYEQVYGIYFAKLLEQITGGEIPDDMQSIVEAYFYGL